MPTKTSRTTTAQQCVCACVRVCVCVFLTSLRNKVENHEFEVMACFESHEAA